MVAGCNLKKMKRICIPCSPRRQAGPVFSRQVMNPSYWRKSTFRRRIWASKGIRVSSPDGNPSCRGHGAADTLHERRASHDEVHTNGGGLCPRHLFGYGLAKRLEPRRMASKGMGHGGGCPCGCNGGYDSVAMVAGKTVKRIPTPENSGVPRDALSWVGGLCSVCGVGYASRKGGYPHAALPAGRRGACAG